MALNYTVYQYDGNRNAVVMTDMDGKELVIDCDKAQAQRLAREEPASYVSFAMCLGKFMPYRVIYRSGE